MTTPNPKQQFTLLATLAANADWDSLTTEEVQLGIMEAQRAGAEFTAFAKNGFRMQTGYLRTTGEFTVQIPALPRPTLEQLQAKHSLFKSIERDTSPSEAITMMNLATILRPGETKAISGAEYEQRLASYLNDLLGFQQLEWLVEHQDEHPSFKALLGKIYVDGPGLVVADANGDRHIPCLNRDGQRWKLCWRCLVNVFHGLGRVASSGKPACQ